MAPAAAPSSRTALAFVILPVLTACLAGLLGRTQGAVAVNAAARMVPTITWAVCGATGIAHMGFSLTNLVTDRLFTLRCWPQLRAMHVLPSAAVGVATTRLCSRILRHARRTTLRWAPGAGLSPHPHPTPPHLSPPSQALAALLSGEAAAVITSMAHLACIGSYMTELFTLASLLVSSWAVGCYCPAPAQAAAAAPLHAAARAPPSQLISVGCCRRYRC